MDIDIENFFIEHSFSANTEDRYRRALTRIGAAYNLSALTAAQFKTWLFAQGWGSSTRWVAYSAIRKYLRWLHGDQHPALKLKIRRDECPPQRSLDETQALRLLASFDLTTVKGIRDLAICGLLLDSGLRSSEICNLDIDRLDIAAGSLQVRIKGGRWAIGVYSEPTAAYLVNWIDARRDILEVNAPPLFVSLRPGQPHTRLTREGLGLIVRRWGKRLNLKLSPHDLRRTFAELSTGFGAPSRVLQIAGRWKNIQMVERYTRHITAHQFRSYFPVAGLISH